MKPHIFFRNGHWQTRFAWGVTHHGPHFPYEAYRGPAWSLFRGVR